MEELIDRLCNLSDDMLFTADECEVEDLVAMCDEAEEIISEIRELIPC